MLRGQVTAKKEEIKRKRNAGGNKLSNRFPDLIIVDHEFDQATSRLWLERRVDQC